MPKVPAYIRRACTTHETSINVSQGVEYTSTRKVIDTACVSNMMTEHNK